jgi:hypothetical protein
LLPIILIPFSGWEIPVGCTQNILAGNGEKYDYIAATRGKDYAFAYTFTGQNINVNTDSLKWNGFEAAWYNPREGSYTEIGSFQSDSTILFDPPGEPAAGNDWVLVLDVK